MKVAIITVLFLITGLAHAKTNNNDDEQTCYQKLLQDSVDSKSHQILEHQVVDLDEETGTFEFAQSAIKILAKKLKCKRNELKFKEEEDSSNCKKIIASKPESNVCYIESNLGYFFVTTDYLDNVNIVFNRWD